MKMNHKSIPSLSSSISTNNGEIVFNHTPRTSSSSTSSYQNQHQFYNISSSIAPKQTNLSHSNSLRSNYTINPIQDDKYKRYSEPPPIVNNNSSKRWDDSQLEMELAEDDLIDKKKKVRRNSSLRLKQKLQLLSAETSSSYIFDKFRHRPSTDDTIDAFKQSKNSKKLSNSLKKVCDWLF